MKGRSFFLSLSALALLFSFSPVVRAELQCKQTAIEGVCQSVKGSFESYAQGAGGNTCKIGNEIKTNIGREECLNELNANFSQIGAQCDALSKMKEGRGQQITFAALHSSMAAACLIPCICGASGVGKPFCVGAEIACAAGSFTLGATELGVAIGMAVKNDDYASLAGSAMGLVGTSISGVMLAKTIAEATGKSAGRAAGSKAGAVLSACLPFAMETLTAGIQWANLNSNSGMYQEQCGATEEFLVSNGEAAIAAGMSAEALAAAQADVGKAIEFDPASQAEFDGALDSAQDELQEIEKLTQDLFSNPESFSAAASSLGKAQPGMGKAFGPQSLKKLKSDLKKLGFSPQQLVLAAAKGGLSDALLSKLGSQLSPDERKNLKKTLADLTTLRGKITRESLADNIRYAKAGRAQPKSQAGSEWKGFGPPVTDGPASATQGTVNFSGASGKISLEERLGWRPDDSDELHEGFRGSVFDLITLRVKRTRSRTERLEWEDPLNRASHGLNPKPSHEPARSTSWDF